jgi:MoaA/NifB/PqqE/SkfB family radical SAM enzyme
MTLRILYRGPLASCNYDCAYCPFAKRVDDRATLAADRRALERFVGWASEWQKPLGILFVPWGEALIRSWYREALAHLSHLPHIERVAIQTNITAPLTFLDRCDRTRVALWCTFHPTQVSRDRFLARCRELSERGVRFSVGAVGLPEHLDELEALRAAMPSEVYVWINAAQGSHRRRYSAAEVERFTRLDPQFPHNLRPPPSLGAPCRAGESVISVDGDGTIRRCHFLAEKLGNLYEPGWEAALQPRTCPRPTCPCHIGYVHRKDLDLYSVFAGGVLERIAAPQVPVTGG